MSQPIMQSRLGKWLLRPVGWVFYALLWWVVIALYTVVPVALIADSNPSSELWTIWIFAFSIVVSVIIWVLALSRKKSIIWPLIIPLVLFMWPIGFTVVMTIGISKMIIMLAGRWGMLGWSRLAPGRPVAPPRGIVEYKSYE